MSTPRRAKHPFPIAPPIEPMLAKLAEALPQEGTFLFEPKWDGFRAIVFRGASDVYIQSRDLKPLDRYFPELHHTLLEQLPKGSVIDGEIVIATPRGLDFDALQMRLHPAASRVAKLAQETPASFVAFDLLASGGRDRMAASQNERRALLEQLFAKLAAPLHLTPMTQDRGLAATWLEGKDAVGSLLLGLYDDRGLLQHVGVTSSFTMAVRKQLVKELTPLRKHAVDKHPWRAWAQADARGTRMPGGQSRWSAGKDLSWEPLRIERVCEVKYDHLQGDRFRHAATFLRWRPDKRPAACRYDQLEVARPYQLAKVFSSGSRRS